jgi:ABC-type Fe3+/spermidine/putrescine transport system ATPase subunit
MNAMLLKTCEVGTQFGRLQVDLAPGETVALLGEAGSGKTATLNALASAIGPGCPPPDSVALVTEQDGLRGDRSVAENLALGLPPGQRDAANRIAHWLHVLGLAGVAWQLPTQLGPDAARRIALGRALVREPQLLLLDEPFRGFEPDQRCRLGEALRRLQRSHGFGMVLATRQARDARAIADRVIVLRAGRMVQQGPTVTVYERPSCAYAARALGEVSFLPGHVDSIEDDVAMVTTMDGRLVEAMVADAQTGQSCWIALRPERVALAAVAPEEMGDGAIAARVESRVHHGDHVRLVVKAAGADIIIRRPPGPEPGAGTDVSIAWQTSHAWACHDSR